MTFSKSNAETNLEVYVDSKMYSGFFTGATGIRFEIRVDGQAGSYYTAGSIRFSNTYDFISMMAVYPNLSAGSHTVMTDWARTLLLEPSKMSF